MTKANIKRIDKIESAMIPDGEYAGLWSGDAVNVSVGEDHYILQTDVTIRCGYCPCIVRVNDGKATIETQ